MNLIQVSDDGESSDSDSSDSDVEVIEERSGKRRKSQNSLHGRKSNRAQEANVQDDESPEQLRSKISSVAEATSRDGSSSSSSSSMSPINAKQSSALSGSSLGMDLSADDNVLRRRSLADNASSIASSHDRDQQQAISTLTARVAALEAALATEQAKSADLGKGLGAYAFVLQQQFAAQAKY